MTTRDELANALARRYAVAGKAEKSLILDEFEAITGMHHFLRDRREEMKSRTSLLERTGLHSTTRTGSRDGRGPTDRQLHRNQRVPAFRRIRPHRAQPCDDRPVPWSGRRRKDALGAAVRPLGSRRTPAYVLGSARAIRREGPRGRGPSGAESSLAARALKLVDAPGELLLPRDDRHEHHGEPPAAASSANKWPSSVRSGNWRVVSDSRKTRLWKWTWWTTTERGMTIMAMLNPCHPGEILRDNLEAAELSVTEAAARLGCTRQALSRLLNGRRGYLRRWLWRWNASAGATPAFGCACRRPTSWLRNGGGRPLDPGGRITGLIFDVVTRADMFACAAETCLARAKGSFA